MTPFDIGLCLLLFWLLVYGLLSILRCLLRVTTLQENQEQLRRQAEYLAQAQRKAAHHYSSFGTLGELQVQYHLKTADESKEIKRLKEQNKKLLERINYIENNRG